MSNRKITNQQFSAGTTVDADRIDAALQSTTEYLNAIPSGDLANRFTQTQIVAGWTAFQKVTNAYQAPWLRVYNSAADRQGAGTIAHPWRVKGTGVLGAAWAAPGDVTQWVWTTSIYVENPCVIDALDMMWQIYSGSDFTTNANPQLTFGNTTGGLICAVSVADPQATEEPIRNSLVVQLRNVYMPAEQLGTDATLFAASTSNMLPVAPVPGMPSNPATQPVNELWFQRSNMQKHIPANSRVSFTVVLQPGAGALDDESYMRGAPNFVITLLEPLA